MLNGLLLFGHTADIYLGVLTPVEPICPQSNTGLEQPTSEKNYTSTAPTFSRFDQLAQSPLPLGKNHHILTSRSM
jgi:hypothetical protein